MCCPLNQAAELLNDSDNQVTAELDELHLEIQAMLGQWPWPDTKDVLIMVSRVLNAVRLVRAEAATQWAARQEGECE